MRTSLFTLFIIATFCVHSGMAQPLNADLELRFNEEINHFELLPDEEINVGFDVVNHGPDDIDTNSLITYGLEGLQFFFIVQDENGDLIPLNEGDTMHAKGISFINGVERISDTTIAYCYYLRVNEDDSEFIHDPNSLNDTLCFTITYKAIPNSLAEKEVDPLLTISPNPAHSQITIVHQGALEKDPGYIRIYSSLGRLVYEKAMNQQKSLNVSVDQWSSGIYFIRYQSGKLTATSRFRVE